MNKRVWFFAVPLLLIGGGIAWAMFRPDPAMARVRELGQQAFDRSREMTDEERRDAFREHREAVEQLSDEQRAQLREEFEQRGMERFEQHMDEFFAMTTEEQNEHLDEQIERMERWSERRERPEAREGGGPPGGGRGQAGRGGPGRGSTLDANARQQRSVDRLDRTSPKFRAKMTEYRRRMEERRAELGYPPRTGGGRGRW